MVPGMLTAAWHLSLSWDAAATPMETETAMGKKKTVDRRAEIRGSDWMAGRAGPAPWAMSLKNLASESQASPLAHGDSLLLLLLQSDAADDGRCHLLSDWKKQLQEHPDATVALSKSEKCDLANAVPWSLFWRSILALQSNMNDSGMRVRCFQGLRRRCVDREEAKDSSGDSNGEDGVEGRRRQGHWRNEAHPFSRCEETRTQRRKD